MNKWQSIAFLDDGESIKTFVELKVIGETTDTFRYKKEVDFFIAIKNNATREKVQEKLIEIELNVISLIYPSAVIGTAVIAGVVIDRSSKIGKGFIINTSSSLGQDNAIEEYVHNSLGVRTAGSVGIIKATWIGIGSVVSNNVNICRGCKVGAGAVVVKDITEPGTFVGVPVRKID